MSPEAAEVEQVPEAWVDAAREVLLETAQHYHRVVTTKALAAEVQERSDIAATQRSHMWIGDVLALVAEDCAERGEPNLSALCVNAEGGVVGGYAATVADAAPEDPDGHAAIERLACYAHFEAPNLPADGGVAILTPKLSASRSRARKATLAARPVESCPRCYMVMPAEGPCNNCE